MTHGCGLNCSRRMLSDSVTPFVPRQRVPPALHMKNISASYIVTGFDFRLMIVKML